MKKSALGLLVVITAVLAGLLSSCSHAKAYPDQCALVVGGGVGDAHQIKNVFLPGQQVSKGDDKAYYLPCGARNFRVTDEKDADDSHPIVAMTGARGEEPALPVTVQLRMNFTLNENKQALKDFWTSLCRKYNCASTHADQGDQSSTRYSTAGWSIGIFWLFFSAIEKIGEGLMLLVRAVIGILIPDLRKLMREEKLESAARELHP